MAGEIDGAVDQIVGLCRQSTSVDVAEVFLKSTKKVSYSASSWDEMRERLIAALDAKAITIDDLWAFQMDAEEHGKQHIFIYRGDRKLATELLDRRRLEAALRKAGHPVKLGETLLVDKPTHPTITNVRLDPSGFGGESMTIKIVETRIHREALPRQMEGEDIEVYRYRRLPYRGINVFRLHADGTLEIRIREHTVHDEADVKRSTRDQYAIAVAKARDIASRIFPYHTEFAAEESLMSAKQALLRNYEKLIGKIRFNFSVLGNSQGPTAKFGTRTPKENLGTNAASAGAMSEWMKHKGSFPETLNLWWCEDDSKDDPTPSMEVHVKIGGRPNEFVIPMNCNGKDYNHVLDDIRRYNRKTA